ncbi:DUF7350 domain-containing protein [Natrialba asiatica]|uniref:DUF7350 domain-containing protein n=1 Tax=Natrialba asiatica (strain ATCC 700177 / DSM 12278 / JCM 9576 / FERM P-10747 / NBRC 102637 / 172P1) TaxID=29540 RepID=M0AQX8_NATA1|nr:hypothetical protein [Natrialba asiatica]ELZ00940.1 hypothetical protein C481_10595 [Natrialba asiatica DSM 12278]
MAPDDPTADDSADSADRTTATGAAPATDATTTATRRTLLRRTGAISGALALAGCLGFGGGGDDNGEEDGKESDGETTDAGGDYGGRQPTVTVEDPPNAVFLPTHREAMRVEEPVTAGEFRFVPMLSYPHPFWTIAGSDDAAVERETPEVGRGVHMMITVQDRETGLVVPVDDGIQFRVRSDGERVGSPVSPWAMLSQEMGFHFGDNVGLPGDGTYEVEVTIPPLSVRRTGALAGRGEERVTGTFEFEYDDEFRHQVIDGIDYLERNRRGERGALEPMGAGADGGDGSGESDGDGNAGHASEMDHAHVPYATVPAVDAYAGTRLVGGASAGGAPSAGADGEATAADELPRSDDAPIVAVLFEADADESDLARLAGDENRAQNPAQYLLVSPRTPYNRVPLPDAALTASTERDGELVAEYELEQTLDSEYGHHYGVVVSGTGSDTSDSESSSAIRSGDSVIVSVDSPPQVARHQGYETAFLEMEAVTFEVPDGAEGGDTEN